LSKFGTGLSMSLRWVPISPLPVSYPWFWNRGKPKPIPKPSQNGKNSSNWVWFGRIPVDMGYVAMPSPRQCWCPII